MEVDVPGTETITTIRRHDLWRRELSVVERKRAQRSGIFRPCVFRAVSAIDEHGRAARGRHHDLVRIDSVIECGSLWNFGSDGTVAIDVVDRDAALWQIVGVECELTLRIETHVDRAIP